MEKVRSGNYVLYPHVEVNCPEARLAEGFAQIMPMLRAAAEGKRVLTVECYPGVDQQELLEGLAGLEPVLVIHSDDLAFEPEKLDAALEQDLLPNDPVFGIMTARRLKDFFYEDKLAEARSRIQEAPAGLVLVYGVGATLVHPGDVQVVADITRWEIQLRYRRGMSNWRTAQTDLPKLKKYKRGFFAEWRWADREKDHLLNTMDFYLDMTTEGSPAMVDGASYREALRQTTRRPFRMVPYFDPGVWGGHWMKDHFALPENGSNYAWSFDGVPEENSLLLDFGGHLIQTPALNLVLQQPRALLGERVHARFGKEFPIRFDMLDTVGGQNLSLQVHPLTEYIQQNFHMNYTQDESYYILDADENASVWLGVKEGVDPAAMEADLRRAQAGKAVLPGGKVHQQHPGEKARPCADPRWHHPLLRRGHHGAGDQLHSLHLHLQDVGLGPSGSGRQAPAHPSGPRHGQHPVGPGHQVGDRKSDSSGPGAETGRAHHPGAHRPARAGVHRHLPHHHRPDRRHAAQRQRACAEPGGRRAGAADQPGRSLCSHGAALRRDLHPAPGRG